MEESWEEGLRSVFGTGTGREMEVSKMLVEAESGGLEEAVVLKPEGFSFWHLEQAQDPER